MPHVSLPAPLAATPLTRRDAIAQGMTPAQIAGPQLTQVMHGVHVASRVDLDLRVRSDAALLAIPEGVLSHRTAATLLGLPGFWTGAAVDVTVPAPHVAPRRRHVNGRQMELPEEDVMRVEGRPLTSPSRTFLDLAETVPEPQLVAIGDAILGKGLSTVDELHARVGQATGRRGVRRARRVLPRLDPRAASPQESLLRVRLEDAGLPRPECNVDVFDAFGAWIARPDLLYRRARIAIEYEGAHHLDVRQFRLDAARDQLLVLAGYVVLRATARDLEPGCNSLIDAVLELLATRG